MGVGWRVKGGLKFKGMIMALKRLEVLRGKVVGYGALSHNSRVDEVTGVAGIVVTLGCGKLGRRGGGERIAGFRNCLAWRPNLS